MTEGEKYLSTNDEAKAQEGRYIEHGPALLAALKLARHEMIASGNWTANDYGWPAARTAVESAIAKIEGRE